MNRSAPKPSAPLTKAQQAEAARLFGKHVSKQKGLLLFAVTSIACLLPIILGIRFWEQIPEIVETGLIGTSGKDDSLPRAVLVFGIPGLMWLLNLICHAQLALYQRRMMVPPTPVRLIGRWGFPILSTLFASGAILEGAGLSFTAPFAVSCISGLFLLLLGSHVLGCSKDTAVALHLPFIEKSDTVWNTTHRIAGVVWLIAGLLLLLYAMFTLRYSAVTATFLLLVLLAPLFCGYLLSLRKLDRLE